MKFSKILTPALSVASVGAIVAPIVTSCNKGYGGIEVTEAQYNEAVAYLTNVTATTNYSSTIYAEQAGESDSVEIKVDKYKESMKVSGTTTYYKNAATQADWKKWNGTAWTTSYTMPSNNVKSIAVAIAAQLSFKDLKYENGGYVYSDDTGKVAVAVIKVDSKYYIKSVEAKGKISSVEGSVKATFSDYTTTTISGYPS